MTDIVVDKMTQAILEYYEQGLDMSDPAVAKVALATLKTGDKLRDNVYVIERPSVTIDPESDGPVMIKLANPVAQKAAEEMRESCITAIDKATAKEPDSRKHISVAIGAIRKLKVPK